MATSIDIPEVVNPVFRFSAASDERRLELRLAGAADARATVDLDAFVRRTHDEARRLGVAEVVVDVTGLSFMSSSCFKAFVGWLASVQELASERQYRIRFAWDRGAYWQRRSLQALKAFAAEIVDL